MSRATPKGVGALCVRGVLNARLRPGASMNDGGMLMAGDDIVDAEWEEVPDNRGAPHTPRSTQHQAAQPAPSRRRDETIDRSPWFSLDFWRSLPWRNCVWLIGGLLILAGVWPSSDDTNSAPASQDERPAAAPAAGSAEQMLSDWSQAVTGKPSTLGFALIDGKGKPGEFCSSSSGNSMMNFGGRSLPPENADLYTYFSWLPDKSNVAIAGSFSFDAGAGELLGHDLMKGNVVTDSHHGIPDMKMKVQADGSGKVTIDGTLYHVCVL